MTTAKPTPTTGLSLPRQSSVEMVIRHSPALEQLRLTRAQRVALSRPCLLAEECMHPRFGATTALGSVVLTVNTGYE